MHTCLMKLSMKTFHDLQGFAERTTVMHRGCGQRRTAASPFSKPTIRPNPAIRGNEKDGTAMRFRLKLAESEGFEPSSR